MRQTLASFINEAWSFVSALSCTWEGLVAIFVAGLAVISAIGWLLFRSRR